MGSSYVSSGARCQARGKVVLYARENLPDDPVSSGVSTEVTRIRSIPLPIPAKFAFSFHWSGFGTKIEYPACYESAQNGDVGDDDSDVVLNMVDAVVDGIRPVGLVESE